MDIKHKKGPITPLWIIAAFITLAETVSGWALIKTAGGVQVLLAIFVVAFPILISATFFYILWNRAHVFYPPSEYDSATPKDFAEAVSPRVREQAEMIRMVEKNPEDKDAQYLVIHTLINLSAEQHLILMHKKNIELPYLDYPRGYNYELSVKDGRSSVGVYNGAQLMRDLDETGFVQLVENKFPKIILTDDGKNFVKWLIDNKKEADYFKCEFGGWGTPINPVFTSTTPEQQEQT